MLSERKWRLTSLLQLLLGLFVIACTGQLVWAGLESLGFNLSPPDKHSLRIIVGTLSLQGAMIILTFLFLRQENLTWSEAFGLKSWRIPKAILLGIFAGIAVVPTALMLQQISAHFLEWFSFKVQSQEVVRSFQEAASKASPGMAHLRQQILFGISVIIIAPIGEELFFRGILYPTFKQFGFPRLGLWTTSILFALLHQNMAGFLSFVFLAVILVWVYEATDCLLASMITHSCFNAANFFYMVFEEPVTQFYKNIFQFGAL